MDAGLLLADLQKQLKKLEDDLRHRSAEYPALDSGVRAEYESAKQHNRTGQTYEAWRDEFLTQVGVAWILACVFVRFIEDSRLLDLPQQQNVWLSGPKERLRLARDRHSLYFREHPTESDREYLEHVFRTVGRYAGARELFAQKHNPIWKLGPSGDAAGMLLGFWQQVDPATGELKYDFTDDKWDTRFLGDLYQDLSEAARKKYALLQTPIFVEEFILDRTLTPAINESGFKQVRLIDPTCGSGHFLLGAFHRLFDLWLRHEPMQNAGASAQAALHQIAGVDLNPFAVAIARFRLLIAALRASERVRLQDAPAFEINLAVGDSLLHGEHPPLRRQIVMEHAPEAHHYEMENAEALNRILKVGHYHAVVGNPPYITVKDPGLNKSYRDLYGSCHMKYSLAVPFMERFFDLAINGDNGRSEYRLQAESSDAQKNPTKVGTLNAGYIGMITANSFMKREFGKKLIEQYIPRWDLTHVIDTSGAYIPGHGNPDGTPTAILFARNRKPIAPKIRTVMGIKSEPSPPVVLAQGKVWNSIITHIDLPDTQTGFVSVTDTPREKFHRHPWSIGGGGAAELKELFDEAAEKKLKDLIESIGFMAITGEDDFYVAPRSVLLRANIPQKVFTTGDDVRNWHINSEQAIAFVYDETAENLCALPLNGASGLKHYSWSYKTTLRGRNMFGKSPEEYGFQWYEYMQFIRNRVKASYLIVFAFVATHNHFILDRGGKVFNRHAQVIKLPTGSSESQHQEITGLLNSSTACFWGRETFFPKGGFASGKWEERLEWDGTKLKQFPIPKHKPLELARALDQLAQRLSALLPSSLAQHTTPNVAEWQRAKQEAELIRGRMIALQEELDWECYWCYGLTPEPLILPQDKVPPINLGERAFEIIMARKMKAGQLTTTWFERHGSMPITEIPSDWPEEYRQLVQRRIELIEQDNNIRLIEQPEYKRRWNSEPWDSQATRALRDWMLNRLEDSRYWPTKELTSAARLADRVRSDREFMQTAAMYRGRTDFDLANLVAELIKAESVPFLPVLRYKESGLRKREQWERTWDLQRLEDKMNDAETRGREDTETNDPQPLDIPVPPKYQSKDSLDQNFWRLRGKLDVPKERFISFPHCSRDVDPSLVIGWAGWNHLEQAQAISAYYEQMKTQEGWSVARLAPLLAGLLELIPWLLQWHNSIDPETNLRLGEFFQSYVEEEARSYGLTLERIKNWTPS